MNRQDIPVLTALRFPAAFAIVLLHYLPMAGFPLWQCEGLGSGVSFFYVLSGFILYYNYHDLKDRAHFWVARFARIWPLHLVTCLMALLLLPFPSLDGHARWPIALPANLLLLHAWIPLEGSALSFNGVSWSLSVEAFFYLCFPLLVRLIMKAGIFVLLAASFMIGLMLVSLAVVWVPGQPNFGIYNPPCRLFEFVLGMSACYLWLKTPCDLTLVGTRYELGIFAVVGSFILVLRPAFKEYCLSSAVSDWLVAALSAAGFAVLIWVFAHQAGAVSRFLSSRVFILLGQISFATYMCHQIILRWLSMNFKLSPELLALSYFVLTIGISWLLFCLVENPARHLIMRLYKSRGTGRREIPS